MKRTRYIARHAHGWKYANGMIALQTGPKSWALFTHTGDQPDGYAEFYELPDGYELHLENVTLTELLHDAGYTTTGRGSIIESEKQA